MFVVFIIVSSIVIGCSKDSSGPVFKGEGRNWSAELITTYSLFGKEAQSIRVKYKGEEKAMVLKDTNITVESSDFLGWGIDKVNLGKDGLYDSGEAFILDNKTPSSAKVTLTIEGNDSEVLLLSSNY